MTHRTITRILALALFVALAPIQAQEKLTLSAPVQKATTEWSIGYFTVDVEVMALVIGLKDNNGERLVVRYPNEVVTQETTNALINGLNTANLSTKSLRRRILERLQSDGFIGAGTFSGGN